MCLLISESVCICLCVCVCVCERERAILILPLSVLLCPLDIQSFSQEMGLSDTCYFKPQVSGSLSKNVYMIFNWYTNMVLEMYKN